MPREYPRMIKMTNFTNGNASLFVSFALIRVIRFYFLHNKAGVAQR